ncbi:MAG: mRNA-degrading endonuclease RelE of RelBE toxin-antitoxin system [Patescibacteria group bacterium]|jgi:mRNA-degrading endonuclease RelE of RelBE toxin-antitoxin system
MNYKILPTKEFIKDYNKIHNSDQERIKNKINEVSIQPERYKHLHPPLQKYSRVKIGKLRVLFTYNTELREIYPEKIIEKHRYNS